MRSKSIRLVRLYRSDAPQPTDRAAERCRGVVDALESRLLLNAAVSHPTKVAVPTLKAVGLTFPTSFVRSPARRASDRSVGVESTLTGSSTPGQGLTPQQVRGAYGVSVLAFNGVAGDGTGETIAILDPGDDASLVNSTSSLFATSDLAVFDQEFGLPNPPSFIKDGFTDPAFGTPALTTTLPGASTGDVETSLDVEWAHVMAPDANILLVEGNSSFSDIFNGVLAIDAAAASMHIVALSMSFSGAESSNASSPSNAEAIDSSYFDAPGLVYVASTGDEGAFAAGTTTVSPQFPATQSNVLAVGGTTLSVSGNTYVGESTWGNGSSSGSSGGGGGGISLYEPLPAYQTGKVNGLSASNRTYPDISLDANPSTGVPVYDSPDYGVGTGWYPGTVGGTSLSAPLMAGLIADADQGRALAGLSPLASSGGAGVAASNQNGNAASSDVHTLLYGAGYGSADFHDITSGSSIGSTAAYGPSIGYDLATGLGSPVANNLVADLSGVYTTSAAKALPITNLYLKESSTTVLGVWVNSTTPGSGTPTASYRLAYVGGINDQGGAGNGTLTVDFSNGNFAATFVSEPLTVTTLNPASSGPPISYVGGGTNNTLVIVGSTASDSVTATATILTLGGGLGTAKIGVSNVQALQFSGGSGGNDTLSVFSTPIGGYIVNASTASGTPNVTLSASNAGTLVLLTTSQRIAGLVLSGGADVQVTSLGSARSHSYHDVLVIGAVNATVAPTFSIDSASKLDLADNDLIIHDGILSAVQNLAEEGRNPSSGSTGGFLDGRWNGDGLTSSAAAAMYTSLGYEQTALAVVQNGELPLGAYAAWQVGSFNEALSSKDIIVKYTYVGDWALEGQVSQDSQTVFGALYGTSGDDWAHGSYNGGSTGGAIDQDSETVFGAYYGLGTVGNGVQL